MQSKAVAVIDTETGNNVIMPLHFQFSRLKKTKQATGYSITINCKANEVHPSFDSIPQHLLRESMKHSMTPAIPLSTARLRLLRCPSPSLRLGKLRMPPEPSSASFFMCSTQSLAVYSRNLIVPCTLAMVISFFLRSLVKGNKSLH